MTFSGGLPDYLDRFRRRLRLAAASRGAGATMAVLLLLTLFLVWVLNRYAFSNGSVLSARTLLFAALAALVITLLVRPLRRLTQRGTAEEIEKRVPAFRGRVETYIDATRKQSEPGMKKNPLIDLLAEDAMKVADAAPAETIVSTGSIAGFLAVALLAFMGLSWLGAAGPGYWGYGTARLWTGWLDFEDPKPLYELIVEPGDATVRDGAALAVKTELIGLEAGSARIFAWYESGVDWEEAPMTPSSEDSGFEFTFAGIREPFRYYVSAGGLRSEEFDVHVVEMPDVENVKLTYAYPKWTGLEEIVEDPGGDIRAVAGTKVAVEIKTDKPLADGVLVVNDNDLTLRADGLLSRGEITVGEDGEYFIAAIYQGERVRLTEDFFITAVPDEKPEVKILQPGRDWSASPIEEVTSQVEASDDYGVGSLELYYSVNGGEFQKLRLKTKGDRNRRRAEHVFYLEDLGQAVEPEPAPEGIAVLPAPGAEHGEGEQQVHPPAEPEEPRLYPGDVISYYAMARDHKKSARTDIYFIEVQPFDRRYRQSQQAGGGMQGGGQRQDEISRRQKEIIAATWNLIQEQQEQDGRGAAEIREAAIMLSELQRTLKGQAQTLAERTRARQLAGAGAEFAEFVKQLDLAVQAMDPAAELLSEVKLRDAIQPEQKALQHLRRAEAVFTDIQVSFQRGGGGGGGGAGRDLAEMFEIEMDLEKNQYETGGGGSQQQLQNEIDDAFKKLEELAKRQEQLAKQAQRKQGPSFSERWRQEMLRREAEELKRQLQQLQRRQESQQRSQQQQASNSSSSSQSSSQGQSGQQGSRGSSGRASQELVRQTIQRLEQATRAMEQSSRAQQSGQSGSQSAAQTQEAQRRLQEAVQQMAEQRRRQAQSALSDLSRRTAGLRQQQEKIAPQLREALSRALAEMQQQSAEGRRRPLSSGLTPEQEENLARRKSEMSQELQDIERRMQEAVRALRETRPRASRKLREALGEMQQSEVGTRLEVAADYIRRGGAAYVASSEEAVTRAIRDLAERTREAERLASEGGQGGRESGLERTLAEMEQLRRALEEAAEYRRGPGAGQEQGRQGQGQQQGQQPGQGQEGRQPGQGEQQGEQLAQGGQGQQPGQGQRGQQPGGRQPGQQPGQGQRGQQGQGSIPGQGQGQGHGDGRSQEGGGGRTPNLAQGRGGASFLRGGPRTSGRGGANYGDWDPMPSAAWQDPEVRRRMEEALRETLNRVPQITNRLRAGGVYEEDLESIRRFVRGLDPDSFPGNPQLLEREYRSTLALLEQLELQVRRQVETAEQGEVRAGVSDPAPEAYREAVAEYFRQLSEKK